MSIRGFLRSLLPVFFLFGVVCAVWSRTFIEGGIATIWFAGTFVTLVYLLFLDERTQVFQQTLAVIVSVMSICFLANLFFVAPPAGNVLRGLVPAVPADTRARWCCR